MNLGRGELIYILCIFVVLIKEINFWLYYFVKLFFKIKFSNVFFLVFFILVGGILYFFENLFIGVRNFKRLNLLVVNVVIYFLW